MAEAVLLVGYNINNIRALGPNKEGAKAKVHKTCIFFNLRHDKKI